MSSIWGLTEYPDILRSILIPYCSRREGWLKEIGQRHVLTLDSLGREAAVLIVCRILGGIPTIGVSLWPLAGLFQLIFPSSHPKWERGKRTGNNPLRKIFSII